MPEDDGSAEAAMREKLSSRYNTVRPFLGFLGESDALGALGASGVRAAAREVGPLPRPLPVPLATSTSQPSAKSPDERQAFPRAALWPARPDSRQVHPDTTGKWRPYPRQLS